MPLPPSSWIALGRWDLHTRPNGIEVCYANVVSGQDFVCGLALPNTQLKVLLGFISGEGDAGDVVFLDHQFVGFLLPVAAS